MADLSILRATDLPGEAPAGCVRLAAAQVDVAMGDPERNLETLAHAVAAAEGVGAGLVVFPECSLTGYCFDDANEARAAALLCDGPELDRVQELCRDSGCTVVVGFLETDGDRLANTAAVVTPEGVAARYRKTHLPHLGVDRWVEPGCDPLTPVDLGRIRLGTLICYDASFPEAARTLALRGADCIVLPTNWPAEAVVKADWLPNTRAYENVIYFAAVNRIGTERGFVFHGRSRICAPTGETLVQGPSDAPALLVADLDPRRAREKRIERRGSDYWVDRIAHRREDLYEL